MTSSSLPLIRLKNAVRLRGERIEGSSDSRPYIGLENIESGTGRLVSSENKDDALEETSTGGESLCNIFKPNDVLFGKLRPYLAKTWVADFEGRCTTELLVMIPNGFDSTYLKYVFLSDKFLEAVNSTTFGAKMPRADWDSVGNQYIYFPDFERQLVISNYLDRETAHIDGLIQAKENLLTMLAEKRQALITQAVTRGLNPDVRLKSSGVDWLGDVPEHWEVERTRWLFRERNERSETGEEEMLTVSHITGVTPRSEKEVNMFEAESTEGYKVCYAGDLVINTLWAWMGAMGIAPLHGIVSPAYHVYTPLSRIEPSYVDVIVRLPIFASEVTRYSKGVWSSRLRLYPEGFYEVYFPVPSLEEQQEIVKYIRLEVNKLNKFQQAAEQTIALLKERRSALITAAVTGQINVLTAS